MVLVWVALFVLLSVTVELNALEIELPICVDSSLLVPLVDDVTVMPWFVVCSCDVVVELDDAVVVKPPTIWLPVELLDWPLLVEEVTESDIP